MDQELSSWESVMVKVDELPEGMGLCENCRGRGMNFDRKTLELNTCKTCDGSGFEILDMDEELQALIGDDR